MNDDNVNEEQAVLLVVKLSDDVFGNPEEQHLVAELEDDIQRELTEEDTGLFDGDEFGGGSCTIFLYGPSAEALATSLLRVLQRHSLPSGSYAIKRFGPPGSAEARVMIGDGLQGTRTPQIH
jgi:hypothetical protein